MGPVVLVVLDGWGVSQEKKGNAILNAKTPTYDAMLAKFPHCLLSASGTDVGLPEGLMGNSEVGHLTIGSGRVVIQKLTIISRTIKDGTFFTNPTLRQAIDAVNKTGGTLHIFGLLSDGCVHSSLDHLDGLLKLARTHNVKNIVIHPILDGRDTPPRSALRFIRDLENKLQPQEKIGVVSGRYYAMDRDTRWERVEKFWRAIVLGDAEKFASAKEVVDKAYASDISDEFVIPAIVNNCPIKDGDSIICFNFRPDRVRQISRALTQESFDGFTRPVVPKVFYVCMTEYDASLKLPIAFDAKAMDSPQIEHTLPEILSCHHIGQFHTAETEKYAHVTYFFNGGREAPEEFEERKLIPSLRVATYDLSPKMQTPEVCDVACQAIKSGQYPFIVLNFANPDMVGHTGMLEAGITAVQSVDLAFAQLLDSIQENKGTLFVTADHGNCEQMIDLQTGEPHTAHTTNPVPFIVANFQSEDPLGLKNGAKLKDGTLADVAPTILQVLGLTQPEEMNGHALIAGAKSGALPRL